MTNGIKHIWDTVIEASKLYDSDINLIFDVSKEKEKLFTTTFKKYHNHILKDYMKQSVETLDRHKIAAIIICSIIDTKIVTVNKNESNKGKVFIGLEMIALSVGLSYMQRSLNDLLRKKGETKYINAYVLPTPIACDTDYFDVLARNLFFARRDYKINPLDIADKLFFIEYLTLKEKMIDPQILRDE